MKIGIDARLIHETGVGRYITNLLGELARQDSSDRYVIFLRRKEFDSFILPNSRWTKRLADVPWHSVSEQLIMPWVLWRERCDIIHIPYFNAPILYPGKFVITIHDLTILHVDTGRASTLPSWLYKIKRLGYRFVLSAGLKRATHILTVSHVVKEDIIRSFEVADGKISVTYEGVDDIFQKSGGKGERRLPIEGPYFLYVGNVFPHKNVETMLEAYHHYIHSQSAEEKLVFVGPADFFYRRLETLVKSRDFGDRIVFLHAVDDETLQALYAGATALLFPSRMEGFGLPAIEAIHCGCQVIVSDIPVFHEILGDSAIFVDTNSVFAFSRAIKNVVSSSFDRREFQKKAAHLLQLYRWSTMARITCDVYNRALHS